MVLETVNEFIGKHRLLEKKDLVLIAFTGGMDSTALLDVLLEFRKDWLLDLFLGHFNHRLRPAAGEDEQFVRKIAQEHALPLFVASEDVRSFARQNRLNLEEAGRMLRYEFLEKTAQKIGGAKIATGHTLNDQAETFFLRLMRGSGLKGLGCISPIVEGRIIRPLLSVEKKDIAEYVKKKGLTFREDESNRDRSYARNKVRLDLIPYIQENFEPNIVRGIGKIVTIIQEEEDLLKKWANHEAKKAVKREAGEVRLDLNSPEFLEVFLRLEGADLVQVAASLDRIRKLDWANVYASKGLNWEAIDHLKAPDGKSVVYSVRLSRRIRALAFRQGEFMRFVSLHPDHDSAYE